MAVIRACFMSASVRKLQSFHAHVFRHAERIDGRRDAAGRGHGRRHDGQRTAGRGAKMIVTSEGLRFGTVGGGKVETKAIAEAQAMLCGETAETTKFAQWNLNKDVGMTCGGIIKLYFESHNVGRWRIVIFGAGHVANALITMLQHFDCTISCIDPREEWLDHLRADDPCRHQGAARRSSVARKGARPRSLHPHR